MNKPITDISKLTHLRVGCNYMRCWGKLHGVKAKCPYFLNPDYRPTEKDS